VNSEDRAHHKEDNPVPRVSAWRDAHYAGLGHQVLD
jgi:hypothetical protein